VRALFSRLIFALLLLLAAPTVGFVRAQTAPDVQGLINSQLDAFARDDADAAYALAAPALKERFADPNAFMSMVKSAYPPVYRHRSVDFGEQARDGDEIRQGAVFVDADNEVWGAIYTLGRQADGEWKITGCVLTRSVESSL